MATKIARRDLRHIIPISGKDSLATAIVQMEREPSLPYEFLFCDVEMELPETYQWLDSVEQYLGISIVRIGKSLETVITEQNMLPSGGRRFCTKYGKIFPIRDYLAGSEAVQYIGFRADEERVAGSFPDNITPRYPLVDAGMGLDDVYRLLDGKGILPPSFFWQRFYDAVISRCGPVSKRLVSNMQPWHRNQLFAWRSRSNCYMCFYQRRYEWVGLLEHYPKMFDRAQQIERKYGYAIENSTLEKDFYWIKDLSLATLRMNAEAIFQRRVNKVLSIIGKMHQGSLLPIIDYDPLELTSCGIYCGK